jgi:hypothetical protein
MKILNKHILFALAILGMLASCEKEFDLKVKDTENKIVINSIFNTTEPICAEIVKSSPAMGVVEINELKNATVSLYENDAFIENLVYQKTSSDFIGKFISTTTAVVGKEYTIKVNDPDLKEAVAKSYSPAKTVIGSESVNHIQWGEDNKTSIRFYFSFVLKDIDGLDNYFMTMYLPVLYVNPTTNDTSFHAYQYAEILTGNLIESQLYIKNGLLFTDAIFNNTNYEISGTATTYNHPFGDFDRTNEENLILDTTHLYISLHHLSYELYNFYSSHATKLDNENDIYSEPTPIFSNIENGLGIFGGENVTVKMIVVEY